LNGSLGLEPVFRMLDYSSIVLYKLLIMVKNNNFFGIDISKDVFGVVKNGENHHQFSNNIIGFKNSSNYLMVILIA